MKNQIIDPWSKDGQKIEEGRQKGVLSEARKMILEAPDIRFSSNIPGDV